MICIDAMASGTHCAQVNTDTDNPFAQENKLGKSQIRTQRIAVPRSMGSLVDACAPATMLRSSEGSTLRLAQTERQAKHQRGAVSFASMAIAHGFNRPNDYTTRIVNHVRVEAARVRKRFAALDRFGFFLLEGLRFGGFL